MLEQESAWSTTCGASPTVLVSTSVHSDRGKSELTQDEFKERVLIVENDLGDRAEDVVYREDLR